MGLSINSPLQFVVKKRVLIYILCIIILEVFCYLNSYVVDLKGASVDAERFQYKAIDWIENGSLRFVVGAELYIQLLGMFFSVFGPHEFIAAQISILLLLGSAIYFEKILKLFAVERTYIWALPLMLWPSLITRATTTMREPILLFLSVLFVYLMLRCANSQSGRDLVKALLVLIVSAFFHKAYAVLMIFMVPFILFAVMRQTAMFYISKTFYMRLAVVFLSLGTAVFVYSNYSEIRGLKPAISVVKADSEYMQEIVDRKSSRDFRTTYRIRLNFSSPAKLMTSAPDVLVHYLFSPFPWKIKNAYDLYAFLEGIFRLTGLILALAILFSGKVKKSILIPVLAFLFVLTAIWAAGTTNYGTASRHHTTTNWIYLIFFATAFQFRQIPQAKERKP